ncbi:MAG TPA: hypothetical protein VFV34_25245 [Blastocatellia bacterium]|nr:hypothetical protein [Blastocatellia bacterium]
MLSLSKPARLACRDRLRDSRARASADAEGFQEILFAIERLGTAALDKVTALGSYEGRLRRIAESSPLAFCIPSKYRWLFTPFDILFGLVRVARNDALHQGAYARHLTSHAIELSLILEDALTTDSATVADFMVKGVVCAELWQPLAYLRQTMLANSFSFLPVKLADGNWALVSDCALALALRRCDQKRDDTLGLTLEKAIETKLIEPQPTTPIAPDLDVGASLTDMKGRPVLVHHPMHHSEVIGIITSFDLL